MAYSAHQQDTHFFKQNVITVYFKFIMLNSCNNTNTSPTVRVFVIGVGRGGRVSYLNFLYNASLAYKCKTKQVVAQ